MYGFENDYDLYPATEANAISEFFSTVWEKIKEFGAKLKEWAGKIKDKIKYLLMTKKEKIEANDRMLTENVRVVTECVITLMGHCTDCLTTMESAFTKVAKTNDTIVYDDDNKEASIKAGSTSYNDTRSDLSAAELKEWNTKKAEVIKTLNNDVNTIKKAKTYLAEIRNVGMATKGALETAYKGITNLYSGNTAMGTIWAQVMKFRDATSGEMKTLLGKVISVYDALRATSTALLNKLIAGKFTDAADSKKTAKELKSFRKGENEYSLGKKDYREAQKNNDIRKHENFNKLGTGRAGIISVYNSNQNNSKSNDNEAKESAFDFSMFSEMDDQFDDVTESVIYDIAYEQAIQDMATFNAIPDASEEFDW